jgi:CHAD domain-containing protein
VAKTPKFAEVAADMPLAEAARVIVRRLIVDALSEGPGVLTGDVEATHDMRVALRKLRTALRTFDDVLPKRGAKQLGTTARRMARRLGVVRDADVHLAVLRPALGGATLEEADGIAHAMGRLHEERRQGLTRLAIELSQLDVNALLEAVDAR